MTYILCIYRNDELVKTDQNIIGTLDDNAGILDKDVPSLLSSEKSPQTSSRMTKDEKKENLPSNILADRKKFLNLSEYSEDILSNLRVSEVSTILLYHILFYFLFILIYLNFHLSNKFDRKIDSLERQFVCHPLTIITFCYYFLMVVAVNYL